MRRALLSRLAFAAACALAPSVAVAFEEISLLTSDGTLHVLRSGTALELGAVDAATSPQATLIDWTSKAQDGTVTMAILPDTVSFFPKHGLDLAYDEQTATLLLLWTENISAFSQIRVGVLHGGTWTNSILLPTSGISQAYNPRMLITHRTATYLDENNAPVTKTSSILSVVWWEWARFAQARYATMFLDETNDPSALAVYDLPALIGTSGDTSTDGIADGAYLYPSLQPDGLSGSVLVSFADLHDQKFKVVRVDFPTDWGKPTDPNSANWKRRHIPIVGIASEGGLSLMMPDAAATRDGVRTSIGRGYAPTLSWGDATSVRYTRLNGAHWDPVRSIALDDTMTYERALDLVSGMAQRN